MANKKMTKKEFFEVLENAHCLCMDDFEGVLNRLSMLLYTEAEEDKRKAKEAEDEETKDLYRRTCEHRKQEARGIFKQLEARGYYEK